MIYNPILFSIWLNEIIPRIQKNSFHFYTWTLLFSNFLHCPKGNLFLGEKKLKKKSLPRATLISVSRRHHKMCLMSIVLALLLNQYFTLNFEENFYIVWKMRIFSIFWQDLHNTVPDCIGETVVFTVNTWV